MFICHLCNSFGKVLKSLAHFLIDFFVLLLLSFKDFFFFHRSPWLDVSSAPILPQSVACLLIFLILSFAEVFNFNEIQLNYLCHKACLWSAYPLSSRFCPMLFYRSFTVFHFTFRSMIHFEKILWRVQGLCSDSLLLHVDI